MCYSRISLKDICLKLQLDSEEDAEFIVAKVNRFGSFIIRLLEMALLMRALIMKRGR